MLLCACCITLHALRSANHRVASTSPLHKRGMLYMQSNDDNHKQTKPLSIFSAATILATLMGVSSVTTMGAANAATTVDKWSYEDATTKRLTEKVTKQQTAPKDSKSKGTTTSKPAAAKSAINIPLPDLKVQLPDLSEAVKQASKLLELSLIHI